MSQITLAVDTDIIAYRVACRGEQKTAFGTHVDEESIAYRACDNYIAELAKILKADRVIMCLSDGPQGGTNESSQTEEFNFRYGVLPSYKHQRSTVERPELLRDVKIYLAEEYESQGWKGLEADDVMGILATHPHLIAGEVIIVSEDKDMRTIPAKVYAPHREQLKVQTISELDADRFHLWQTIVGDAVDGYGGAKGVGPKSDYAQEILVADREDLWNIVWEAFSSKGHNESDAIVQARVARILRSEDFDIESETVKLWCPEMLMRGVV